LDYRGYDSAGVLLAEPGGPVIEKTSGRLWDLREHLDDQTLTGAVGMGHTRWATHGQPTQANAHPHRTGQLVLVHNGIVENFLDLKEELEQQGINFVSDTDTEILGQLIDREVSANKGDILAGIRAALKLVVGSYALSMWFDADPGVLWFAREASPLVVGLAKDHNVLASDPLALVAHTRRVVYLNDGELGRLGPDDVEYWSIADGASVQGAETELSWEQSTAERGPYKHYMIKEIHEQPDAVEATLDHLLSPSGSGVTSSFMSLTPAFAKDLDHVQLLACGTSLHAAMVARHYFHKLAGLPAYAEQAGEWRSLGGKIPDNTLTVAFSQSGETADTLVSLREIRAQKAKILGIVNVPESSIARISDAVIHTMAGPEVSVASTKAFTTQIAASYLLAARLGFLRGHLDQKGFDAAVQDLRSVIPAMRSMLLRESRAHDMAMKLTRFNHALFLGRGVLHPIALEGALKLKEISYLHAEGYSASEMKHGPIALIDEDMATVMLVQRGSDYAKALGNLQEIKARDGFVLAVITEGDERLGYHTDAIFPVPAVPELLQPLVSVMPLQLMAYHVADYRGTDVDKPRNLAKSVTVE
jgi:glucosamine--fructose-6-phosphate aminotransferase (isomerizing)